MRQSVKIERMTKKFASRIVESLRGCSKTNMHSDCGTWRTPGSNFVGALSWKGFQSARGRSNRVSINTPMYRYASIREHRVTASNRPPRKFSSSRALLLDANREHRRVQDELTFVRKYYSQLFVENLFLSYAYTFRVRLYE